MSYIRLGGWLYNAVCQYAELQTDHSLLAMVLKIEAKFHISDPMSSLGELWSKCLSQFFNLLFGLARNLLHTIFALTEPPEGRGGRRNNVM